MHLLTFSQASDMPNYFIMMGPNAVIGHGSLMEALNWTGDYFCRWIRKIATEDIRSVVPKESAVRAFNDYCDEIHKTLVWSGDCVSWSVFIGHKISAACSGADLLSGTNVGRRTDE
jgi:hypothetical protein